MCYIPRVMRGSGVCGDDLGKVELGILHRLHFISIQAL